MLPGMRIYHLWLYMGVFICHMCYFDMWCHMLHTLHEYIGNYYTKTQQGDLLSGVNILLSESPRAHCIANYYCCPRHQLNVLVFHWTLAKVKYACFLDFELSIYFILRPRDVLWFHIYKSQIEDGINQRGSRWCVRIVRSWYWMLSLHIQIDAMCAILTHTLALMEII